MGQDRHFVLGKVKFWVPPVDTPVTIPWESEAVDADARLGYLGITEREWRIVRLRIEGNTLHAIGAREGVGPERIRQRLAMTQRKLAHPSRSHVLKRRSDIPLWNWVFAGEDWQADPALGRWEEEE